MTMALGGRFSDLRVRDLPDKYFNKSDMKTLD